MSWLAPFGAIGWRGNRHRPGGAGPRLHKAEEAEVERDPGVLELLRLAPYGEFATPRRRALSPPTWSVRKCSWTDFEVTSPFAELVVEAESPILMHGPVADVESNVDRILAPLRAAGVADTAECYDAGGEMLREWRWGTD
jgi:hypothetical protein